MGTSFGTWTDPKTGQMWLRDFLPTDLPTARISTFGYDAAIFGRSVLKLGDVANNLLAGVRSIRDEKVRFLGFSDPFPLLSALLSEIFGVMSDRLEGCRETVDFRWAQHGRVGH